MFVLFCLSFKFRFDEKKEAEDMPTLFGALTLDYWLKSTQANCYLQDNVVELVARNSIIIFYL